MLHFARVSSNTSGFFLWGMILDPVVHSSGSFTKPKFWQLNMQASKAIFDKVPAIEAKAKAITEAARKFVSGEWDDLPLLSDEEVEAKLTEIKGIGRWTAEMYLLFTLNRKSVLSYGDYGIRKGICALFGYKTLSRKRFEAVKRKLSPHLSLASLYLWEIAAGK